MTDSIWHEVAPVAAVTEGCPFKALVSGVELGLYKIDGELFAIDDICTHAHALLTEGYLDGYIIECPLHGGCFDVRNGRGQGLPITADVRSYPVKIEGDAIYVAIDRS